MRSIITFLLLYVSSGIFAQFTYSEKVTDKWPYLFNEFHQGIIYYNTNKASKASFNIDVANQQFVYFEDDELIKSVNQAYTIDSLVLSNSMFIVHENEIYEVLESGKNILLLKRIRIAMNSLNENSGGYGTGSSTDATTRLTSVDVANYTNVPWNVVKLEKNKGKVFELITGFYLLNTTTKKSERLTKKNLSKIFPEKDVNKIMKTKKLKLKSENDIKALFNLLTN
ncbi:MAG: hypothetical protein JW735_07225 [Prolixibacteraceae bacterium]|nr:hypothetical protein [Prolixibacteraceae bacterium]